MRVRGGGRYSSVLQHITPLILTLNEAPNIKHALDKLRWAKNIILVDSYSDDETLTIASRFPNVRIFQRKFDSHAVQWNYGLKETGITTEWVLALDADYILTDELLKELENLDPVPSTAAFRAHFVYCVFGKKLRGTVYPPVTVLYRRDKASYLQDGHTQRVVIDGHIADLSTRMLHDDRKPLTRWLISQDRYMRLEAEKLSRSKWWELCWADRARRMVFISPFLIFFYCLIVKGAILDGRAGLYYALQRMTAECILSLRLLYHGLMSKKF